jgi:hypothetical protein
MHAYHEKLRKKRKLQLDLHKQKWITQYEVLVSLTFHAPNQWTCGRQSYKLNKNSNLILECKIIIQIPLLKKIQ